MKGKLMKKIILILIFIIIIIISGIFVIKNVKKDKFDYKIETISKYDYYIYKENEKSGVIDRNGNIVINATYEKLVIPNPR